MTSFGVLLPHFGDVATVDRVIRTAPQLEAWGFRSVWTRDNVVFRGHGFEPEGTRLMDAFSTLSAIAMITDEMTVGTATLVPIRHPLLTSQLLGGIANIAGPGRLIAGLGAGGQKKSFDVLGIDWDTRVQRVKEQFDVLRLSFNEEVFSYSGEFYDFEDASIDPHPGPETPLWYGGSTPASVRRAVEWGDGWFPGRCPMRTVDKRLETLRKGEQDQGRSLGFGIIPIVSIDTSKEAALEKANFEALCDVARKNKWWDGPFDTPEDLSGMLIAGTVDDFKEEIAKFVARGCDQLVFDFRMRPGEYDEQVEWVATEVLQEVGVA